MITVLYTDSDAIRSTIGLDDADLSDAMISSQNLELQMIERLEDFLPTYEAVHDNTDAGERRMILWCQYFGALQLLENTTLGIAQKIQANNDQLSRFAVDFEALKDSLKVKLAALETKLTVTATGLAPTTVTLFGKVTPDFDPVTG